MVYSQVFLFLIFLINGSIIGILFDLFRILRKSFKTGIIITAIEDILFWILTGIIILYCIFTFNNGVIRGYMFIGIFLGITFYILTLSRYFVKINTIIIKFIKNIISKVLKIMCIPFKIIIRFISYIRLFLNKKLHLKKFAKFAKKTNIKEGFSEKV